MTTQWRPLPGGLGHVRLSEARPALRTHAGEYLRLHGVPAGGRRARRAYRRDVAAFARDRAAAQRDARWPEGRRRVAVVGRGRTVTEVAAELRRLGADVRRLRRPVTPAPPVDLVVSLGAGPTDDVLEQWLVDLSRRGTAVLHGHPEGAGFLLLPLMLDGTEATPDQVRRRRLAASPAADELGSWLTAPSRAAHTPGVRALVVAQVTSTVLSWAADDPAVQDLRHTLTVIHPDLRQTSHVVLGFDEPSPRPVRA